VLKIRSLANLPNVGRNATPKHRINKIKKNIMNKLPENFEYLADMYNDQYFPNFLVDKVKNEIVNVVKFIEEGNHTTDEIQSQLDIMTLNINDLEEEFNDNDSEIETVARDSIGVTVEKILHFFSVDIDIEEAIREREW